MDWIDNEREGILKNFTEILRDINIDIISGEKSFNFIPNIKKLKKNKNIIFNQKYWKIIEKYKHTCIITGSASLLSFGLIDRDLSDIDLIHMSPDEELEKSLLNSSSRYHHAISTDNIGFKYEGEYYVDFFKLSEKTKYIELDGYKFENPFDILLHKYNLIKKGSPIRKNYEDIKNSLIKMGYDLNSLSNYSDFKSALVTYDLI